MGAAMASDESHRNVVAVEKNIFYSAKISAESPSWPGRIGLMDVP